MMKLARGGSRLAAAVVAVVALVAVPASRAGEVYLSLGDSLAFGYDPSTASTLVPSMADQGFASRFADGLGLGLVNLGVAGEQAASFINPANLATTGPPRAWQLNQNYPDGSTPQFALMQTKIGAIQAAGDAVGVASLILGANDIFALAASPAFQAASAVDQQTMVGGVIHSVLTTYGLAVQTLQAMAPGVRVFLPGYYNPYPVLPGGTTRGAGDLYEMVLAAFNPALKNLAGSLGVTYVDLYTPFLGRELELTNIATGDVHPNQAGYRVIADQMLLAAGAPVPEPASIGMLMLGLAGAGTMAWRRRKAA